MKILEGKHIHGKDESHASKGSGVSREEIEVVKIRA
jgi:hypothetical protein